MKIKHGYLREIKSVLPTIYLTNIWFCIYGNCKIIFEWQGYWVGFGMVKTIPCEKCFMKSYKCTNNCKEYKEWANHEQGRKTQSKT